MENQGQKTRFGDLRAILQYVPLFRGNVFVVAIDGALLESPLLPNLLLDLAVLQSLNIRVILVHGASFQIERLAHERGIALTTTDGVGRTDAPTLEVSVDAITRLGNKLLQQLSVAGMRAAFANALVAHQTGIVHGQDQEFSGTIDRVDVGCLTAFLNEGLLPIIPPLGYDRHGNTLRLNSDSVATEVAIAMRASKVVFLTLATITNTEGRRIRQLSYDQAAELATGGGSFNLPRIFLSKLKYSARACREVVPRSHIVNGYEPDALLTELFSNEGSGTMVYADAYQEIRGATQADIAAIVSMIRNSVHDEDLLPRTADDIAAHLTDYSVIDIDGNIVGCVAVHWFEEDQLAELACLYIKRNHENQGYGKKLVEFAIRRASQLGAHKLVALTTGARGFFERYGAFERGTDSDLPSQRRSKLEASGRRSEILRLFLRRPEPSLVTADT